MPGDSQGFKGSDHVSFFTGSSHGYCHGHQYGGDDFVTKPFDQNVLLAKVQGLLRRSYEFGTDQNLLEHRGAILNLKSTDLVYEGKVIKLTKNEFQILRVLFEHAGSIVARDDMMKGALE